jgi:hypothetical protein
MKVMGDNLPSYDCRYCSKSKPLEYKKDPKNFREIILYRLLCEPADQMEAKLEGTFCSNWRVP